MQFDFQSRLSQQLIVGRGQSLFDAIWAILGVLLGAVVVFGSVYIASDIGDTLTRNLIRLTLGWHTLSLVLFIRLKPADWQIETVRGKVARWCWTWACLCF